MNPAEQHHLASQLALVIANLRTYAMAFSAQTEIDCHTADSIAKLLADREGAQHLLSSDSTTFKDMPAYYDPTAQKWCGCRSKSTPANNRQQCDELITKISEKLGVQIGDGEIGTADPGSGEDPSAGVLTPSVLPKRGVPGGR